MRKRERACARASERGRLLEVLINLSPPYQSSLTLQGAYGERSSRQANCHNFSKVSALVHVPYAYTVEPPFEFYRSSPSGKASQVWMEAVLNGWLLMFGLCQALSIWKGRGGRAGGIDGWRGGGRERGREGGRERPKVTYSVKVTLSVKGSQIQSSQRKIGREHVLLHTNTHVLFQPKKDRKRTCSLQR